MWWIFVIFVVWTCLSFLHAEQQDHDVRLRLLEDRKQKGDAPRIYPESKEDTTEVKIDET